MIKNEKYSDKIKDGEFEKNKTNIEEENKSIANSNENDQKKLVKIIIKD